MTSDAHSRYLATRHFGSLDGLRCLSIVPVIWHHCTPRPLPGLLGKGPVGVDLFFCISGFLITTLLLREKAHTGGIQLPSFYARRALRILPLYYAVLLSYLVFAALLPPTAPQRAHFFRTLPLYATFTANWFADFGVWHPILFSFAWSLCVEEQFYAFWPWLVRRLSRRAAFFAMTTIIVVIALAERGALVALLPQGGLALRVLTSFATPIGLGAILALALDARVGFSMLSAALGRRWSAPIALAAVGALVCSAQAPLFVLQLGLAGLVGACVAQERHGLTHVLRARAPSYVGRVSYGLYLLNLTAIGCVRRAFPLYAAAPSFVFALSFPLALGLAALSQRYFESPLLGWRVRFRSVEPALAPTLTPESGAHSSSALHH